MSAWFGYEAGEMKDGRELELEGQLEGDLPLYIRQRCIGLEL